MVLPVWLAPDGARAWQADNKWLAGWREAVSTADGLVDFTLLEPTILNERSLRAEDIVAADPATLRRAATVSGAEQIMLVTARLDYAGSQPVLAVDGTLFTSSAEQVTVLAKMVDRPVYENLTVQLDYARMHILSELETGWHSANIIEGGETREVTVEVPVASLQDWVARLEALDAIPVVDSYVVRQLGITGGVVTINRWEPTRRYRMRWQRMIRFAGAMTAPPSSNCRTGAQCDGHATATARPPVHELAGTR